MNLSPHFRLDELSHTGTGLPNTPGPAEVSALVTLCDKVLEPVRAILGVPLRINSGFRSDAVNAAIGGAKKSQHRLGEAADIVPVGYPGGVHAAMVALVDAVKAKRLTVDQLICYPAGGFLHVSYTTTKANRNQMLRSAASGGSGGPYSAWIP